MRTRTRCRSRINTLISLTVHPLFPSHPPRRPHRRSSIRPNTTRLRSSTEHREAIHTLRWTLMTLTWNATAHISLTPTTTFPNEEELDRAIISAQSPRSIESRATLTRATRVGIPRQGTRQPTQGMRRRVTDKAGEAPVREEVHREPRQDQDGPV